MKSFRVALFTGNYNHIHDGVSQTLNRLVKFLEDAGVEVLVFGPSIENPQVEHEGTMVEIPSIAMPGRTEYRISVKIPRKQRELLEKFDPDIVHLATPDLLGLQALRWARKNRKRIVSSYHTHFTSYLKYYRMQWLEPLMWRYLRWFYGHALQVHSPAPSMAEELKKRGFKSDLRVWSRGIDTTIFSPDRRDPEWRRELGFADDELIVLFVSRLVWEKNLDIYANTVKAVMERSDRVRPLVVGEGPAMEDLRKMLPEAVYTGYLSHEKLAKVYASSDIFLFPSITEAFGNVTLEAMASGLPCVVADAVGSKSLVDHGGNGFLVSVSEPESFNERVYELVMDDDLRRKMGETSISKSSKYSWDRINGELLSGYREALKTNTDIR